MSAKAFIAGRLRFKGKMAVTATAISSFVMICAVAISSGFRHQIGKEISAACPDVTLSSIGGYTGMDRIPSEPACLQAILEIDGVQSVQSAIWRSAIVKTSSEVEAVMLRSNPDIPSGEIEIPLALSRRTGLEQGDKMLCYFVSDRVQARNFTIREVRRSAADLGDAFIANCSLEDLRRLEKLPEELTGVLEISLEEKYRNATAMKFKASEIGMTAALGRGQDEPSLLSTSAADRYSSLFAWLQLIDANVLVILLLMSLVAGFNMISALLILLMRSVSSIGMLKAMGAKDKEIRGIYLRISGRHVALGLLAGNAAALLLCAIQGFTHIIKMNPENYFVDFLPVHINLAAIILVDLAAWLVIMALLSLGAKYVSRIDPAESCRAE